MLSRQPDDVVYIGVLLVVAENVIKLCLTIADIHQSQPTCRQINRHLDDRTRVLFLFFWISTALGKITDKSLAEVERMDEHHKYVPFFNSLLVVSQVLDDSLEGFVEINGYVSHF
jgi:hypothetical protein